MTDTGFDAYGTPPTPPPPSPPVAEKRRLRTGALAGTAAAVALAAGLGLGHVAWSTGSPSVAASGAPASTGSGSTVSSIAAKVDPGLVDIDTTLGYSDEEAAGTGIVLTSNGEILTNNHVIDGATTISVTDVGNGKTYSASLVGYDKTKDVAVLQLHDASGLQTASIDTSTASVGETVVGIGNAGGTGGTPSAAGGTVTALNQSITASDEGDGTSEQLTGLIETDANIQAGDSGGSLVNSAGQVIGMDTAASSGTSFQSARESSGYQGYAIPIGEATTLGQGDRGWRLVLHRAHRDDRVLGRGDSGGRRRLRERSLEWRHRGRGHHRLTRPRGRSRRRRRHHLGERTHGRRRQCAHQRCSAPYKPGDKVTIGWTDASGQTHTATVTLSSGPPQ